MKKALVIFCLAIVTLAASSFAGNSFIATGGTNLNMNSTDAKFSIVAKPTMAMGYGMPTTGKWFGDITPNETFLIGQYTRAKVVGSQEHISIYTAQVAGLWYFRDTLPKFQPFFVLKNQVDFQRSDSANTTYWYGGFGLGFTYPVSVHAKFYTNGTVEFGNAINTDLVAGLKFTF